jgi:hypothetical protein
VRACERAGAGGQQERQVRVCLVQLCVWEAQKLQRPHQRQAAHGERWCYRGSLAPLYFCRRCVCVCVCVCTYVIYFSTASSLPHVCVCVCVLYLLYSFCLPALPCFTCIASAAGTWSPEGGQQVRDTEGGRMYVVGGETVAFLDVVKAWSSVELKDFPMRSGGDGCVCVCVGVGVWVPSKALRKARASQIN